MPCSEAMRATTGEMNDFPFPEGGAGAPTSATVPLA